MELHDPEVKAGALALAYSQKPINIKGTREEWWSALSQMARDLHLYRASVVLEAVDQLRSTHVD